VGPPLPLLLRRALSSCVAPAAAAAAVVCLPDGVCVRACDLLSARTVLLLFNVAKTMTGIAAASFFSNICQFGGCGLHFESLAELIVHIEDNHIGKCARGNRIGAAAARAAMAGSLTSCVAAALLLGVVKRWDFSVLLDFVALIGIDSTSSQLIRGLLSPFKVTWSERVNTSGGITM